VRSKSIFKGNDCMKKFRKIVKLKVKRKKQEGRGEVRHQKAPFYVGDTLL